MKRTIFMILGILIILGIAFGSYNLGQSNAYEIIEKMNLVPASNEILYTSYEVIAAQKIAYNDAKSWFEPEYINISRNFMKTHKYINDTEVVRLQTPAYQCRHFAVEMGEALIEAGYNVEVQTGYYNDGGAHAINIIHIPISNGKIVPISYSDKWERRGTYTVEEYKYKLIKNGSWGLD